jgi:flagellar biosynthesis protein FlhF
MQVHTFIVDNALEAVEQVRAKLGPGAVVLSVRRLPVDGLSKLWKKPRIEVLAAAPPDAATSATPADSAAVAVPIQEPGMVSSASEILGTAPKAPSPSAPAAPADPLAELRRELSEIRAEIFRNRQAPTAEAPIPSAAPGKSTEVPARTEKPLAVESFVTRSVQYPGEWHVGPILESTGLLPVHALRVVEQLCQDHGETAPKSLGEEILLTAKVLQGEWILPTSSPNAGSEAHVFIGPPGSGKTTALCKWLAQSVLLEGKSATVWRLDGLGANTAESLSVYGEILGVPVERFLPEGRPDSGLLFIDYPGVAPGDAVGMADLKERLAALGPVRVHLVLNAAYENAVVLSQARAYHDMGVTDIIATHLDEEPRWGKLWSWILGTNYPIGWLGVGQNVPGVFLPADPNRVLTRQFSREN